MFKSLDDVSTKLNLRLDKNSLAREEEILNIYNGKFEKIDMNDSYLLPIIGNYYMLIKKDYITMKKYYMKSINFGSTIAMTNLGLYYFNKKDYMLMKKYYLMAIYKNYADASLYLACYYTIIEKNSTLMKKYYLIAIELENDIAMNNLGCYYRDTEKDYDLMTKYLLMAIDKDNIDAMNNLGSYYLTTKCNMKLAKPYYLMAIKNGNNYGINIFSNLELYINLGEKYYSNNKEINIYKNKMSLLGKELECPICMEDCRCIPLECCHYVCGNCYLLLYKTKCAECRMDFST
jgi:tetratricopeptide (TPR) repeat protein